MSYYYKKEQQILKNKSFIYRYPRTVVSIGTFIGAGLFWSPIIYSFTHTEEEVNELKAKFSFMKIR